MKQIFSCYTFSILIIFSFFSTAAIQAQLSYNIEYEVQLSNGNYAPFWLTSNRQGITSIDNNNGLFKIGFFNQKTLKKDISYQMGIEIADKISAGNDYFLHQAYVDFSYRKLQISAGCKEKYALLKNNLLTSGGMAYSGNARPIPQIRLGSIDYISFPWLMHGQLKINAGFSYGWFTDNTFQKKMATTFKPYNQNILYHHKDIAFQYDIKDSPWRFDIAIETNTEFGSDHYLFDTSNPQIITIKKSDPSLKNYLMVLFPLPGDKSSVLEDQEYMYGNSLGSEHVRATFRKKDFEISGYLENYFEDFSGMAKENGLDGLWGIEYKNKSTRGITGIVIEYIQTTNQSGPIHWAPDDEPTSPIKTQATGSDNYYNNHAFSEGWAHNGINLGNPLLTSPVYNQTKDLWHYNNRIQAIHSAFSWKANKMLSGRMLTTWSRNFGSMDIPFITIQNQLSTLTEITFSPRNAKGWSFTFSGAFDRGETVIGNNSGFAFNIKKSGIL
ncbi:MAG: capsule assembly Wzi family protein [Bacteroidales bacterium]|nr:capsule assembly Wzi family protein [Bacteroidales bacterium]